MYALSCNTGYNGKLRVLMPANSEPDKRGPWERTLRRRQFLSDTDPMLEDVIKLVVEAQEASASLIQRKLGLGYPRAARIMDLLEELGVVGDVVGGRAFP